jgi:hypothetical protein
MTPNGIFQGYRWYDQRNVGPLFPFGHGLSYTQFGYSNLTLTPRVGSMDVAFDVANTGAAAGTEVSQIYVGSTASAPVPLAVRGLAGFDRISLSPHETKHVTIHLGARAFQYWDAAADEWATAWGDRTVSVGSSSRDLRLSGVDAPLKPAAQEVLDLLAMVQGVGPGTSLNDKVKAIQGFIESGQTTRACSEVAAFENQVRAQTGKSIPVATAAALEREAGRLAASIGC